MKKIISRYEREKRNKRNQLVVGVVLVGVMLFSTIGYAFQSGVGGNGSAGEGNQITYNGVDFSYVDGFWRAGAFAFKYNPEEVQASSLNLIGLNPVESYRDRPVYIYSQDSESENEINVNLRQVAQKVESVCIEGEVCGENFPTKNCDEGENMIVIKKGEESSIRQEGNCVFIEGKSYELSQLTDRFLFSILGVI